MRWLVLGSAAAAIAIACTTGFNDDPPFTGPPDAGAVADAGPCDPRATFLSATRLTISTVGVFDGRPSLPQDELAIFWERSGTLMQAQRMAIGADFTDAGLALAEGLGFPVSSPAIAPDGGLLVGTVDLDGVVDAGADTGTGLDLYASPPPRNDAWWLGALDTAASEEGASFSADGTKLYFSSSRLGPFASDEDPDSLFVASLGLDGGFINPLPLADGTTNSKLAVGFDPTPSADGKNVYFARRQAAGTDHVFVADLGADGVTLTNLTALAAVDPGVFGDDATNQFPGMISSDNCRLYFASDTTGDSDLYVASRR